MRDMHSAQMGMGDARLDYSNALVDSLIVKGKGAETVKGSDQPEDIGKCINPATGEPVSARREDEALSPIEGSKEPSADGNGTGLCPECTTRVKLSKKGWVTAHTVRNVRIPLPKAAVRLVERKAAVTESGPRTGSPDAAMRARGAELSGAFGTGTVRIKVRPVDPVTGEETGKAKEIPVPNTEENVRTAIRQEQRKKQRKCKKTGQMIGGPNAAKLAELGAMLRGITGTVSVPVPGAEPGMYKIREAVTWDRDTASSRDVRASEPGVRDGRVPSSPGPALHTGRAMSGAEPGESDRVNRHGKPKNAIGWDDPANGRVRVDPMVSAGGNPGACQGRNKGRGCKVAGCVAIVGGAPFGYLTCAEFRTLSARQRQRYWEGISKRKRVRDAARERAKKAEAIRDAAARSDVRGIAAQRYRSGKPDDRAAVQIVGRA